MDNIEKWRYYMKDITSPDSYIEMGYYWLISSALQRRVWLGSEERPLFPNLYVLLVGKPAVGKGLVIKPLTEMLSFHKMRHKDKYNSDDPNSISNVLESIESEMYKSYVEKVTGGTAKNTVDPLIFPMAADSTTYEALVRRHANAIRFHIVTDPNLSKHPFVKDNKYKYCSLSALLEEVSTLFRKKNEDIVRYLMKAYDCGDHEHDTKTQGTDVLQKISLTLLGGTTPEFMRECFTDRLLNDGFASRTIVVYAERNRFNRFDIASLCKDQLRCKAEIILHLRSLAKLFGKVSYDADAYELMKHYIEQVLPVTRTNVSSKLESYYGRKNLHVQKLAMAIHFSESTSMSVSLKSCIKSIELLNLLEINMDKALVVSGKNVVGDVVDRIIKFIGDFGPKSRTEIWGEFIKDLNEQQIDEALRYLVDSNKVKKIEHENNGRKFYKYKSTAATVNQPAAG